MATGDGYSRHTRLLLISGLWPTADAPSAGIFVKRRADRMVGVRVIAPASYRSPTIVRYLSLAWRGLTARGRYDGVEVHWLFPTGLIGLLAGWIRRIPVLVYAHGDDVKSTPLRSPLHRFLVGLIIHRADLVVTNSRDTARHVRAFGAEALVVPPGVDLHDFQPSTRPPTRRILYLGGLVPGKGFDHARGVADTLMGPGLDERRADEIPGIIAAHDIVLVPSDDEAFGLVAAEAIASGRWVVANDVGGLREIVIDGVNGTLVDDGDFRAAVARVPDYDPWTVATTVQRFDAKTAGRHMDDIWATLLSAPDARS